jgi:hypothetical protein
MSKKPLILIPENKSSLVDKIVDKTKIPLAATGTGIVLFGYGSIVYHALNGSLEDFSISYDVIADSAKIFTIAVGANLLPFCYAGYVSIKDKMYGTEDGEKSSADMFA